MIAYLLPILMTLALAGNDPPKPFWQVNYEHGVQALKVRNHAEAIRFFEKAILKATADSAARATDVIAEMNHGIGISYKALAVGEHANKKYKRLHDLTEASAALRRARSWYKERRGADAPILMELTDQLAEVHELKMLDSGNLSHYFGQRPNDRPKIEGVWEAYLTVLKDKETRLGQDDPEVVKYRRKITRKLWNALRNMRKLSKTCKNEETIHNAKSEMNELKALANALKEKNRAIEEAKRASSG